MTTCKTCREYTVSDRHMCDPAWSLWRPEDAGETEEDAHTIYAMSPESAVEKWAEWSDRNSADYSIVGGSDTTVHVRYAGTAERAGYLMLPTEELVLTVYGESVPSYTAVRKRAPKAAVQPAVAQKEGSG